MSGDNTKATDLRAQIVLGKGTYPSGAGIQQMQEISKLAVYVMDYTLAKR